MDNKAYLDQIAVKSRRATTSKPFFTPLIIKLIAAGVVLATLFLVVGIMLNNRNQEITQKFETLYYRAVNLAGDESPFYLYGDDLQSPSLRQYNAMLRTTLLNFNTQYAALLSTVKIDPEKPTTSIADSEAQNLAAFDSEVKDGYLKGTIDHSFSASAYYQVSLLITIEQEARSVTTNTQVAEVINNLNSDLIDLQEKYKEFSRNN